MKTKSDVFSLHDIVKIIGPNSSFHNQVGTITDIKELTGSDAGSGNSITVKLHDTAYELSINIFTTLSIVHNN